MRSAGSLGFYPSTSLQFEAVVYFPFSFRACVEVSSESRINHNLKMNVGLELY